MQIRKMKEEAMPFVLSRLGTIGTCGYSHETKAQAFICWNARANPAAWALIEFPALPGAAERFEAFGSFVPMEEALR